MTRTGLARADITPRGSVPLFGYGDRTHDSTGVHDPLSVYAWWLEPEGQPPCAWVVLDLCVLGIEAAEELARQAVDSVPAAGLSPRRLLLSTTHTHSGPDTLAIHADTRPWAPEYRQHLCRRIAEAMEEARSRAVPCRIEARLAAGSLGVNRRDPSKPVDPRVVLLSLVDGEGALRGVLFHYSCHLTVLGVDNDLVSADWAGPVRESLERELSVPACFLQGAEGNIDPHTRGFLDMADPDQARGSSFEVLDGLARTLTAEIREGLATPAVRVLDTAGLQEWSQELPLRYGPLTPPQVRERIEKWKRGFSGLLGVPAADVPEDRIINALVKQRCRELSLAPQEVRRQVAEQFAYGNFLVAYAGLAGPTAAGVAAAARPSRGVAEVPCRLLDLGGLCILCAPAEILVEAAFDWQLRLPGRIALLSGLVGGWMGYLPHAANFAETEAGERYETVSTMFAPAACAALLEEGGRRAGAGKGARS
jgi:hypothetical protein